MKRIATLAVLFTLAMICGGCTGSATFGWGPEGTEYKRTIRPYAGYQPPFPMDEPSGFTQGR